MPGKHLPIHRTLPLSLPAGSISKLLAPLLWLRTALQWRSVPPRWAFVAVAAAIPHCQKKIRPPGMQTHRPWLDHAGHPQSPPNRFRGRSEMVNIQTFKRPKHPSGALPKFRHLANSIPKLELVCVYVCIYIYTKIS